MYATGLSRVSGKTRRDGLTYAYAYASASAASSSAAGMTHQRIR
jgi:hypothetical protein